MDYDECMVSSGGRGHQRSDMRLNTSMICCRIVHFHWFYFIFFSSFLCLLRNQQFQPRIKKQLPPLFSPAPLRFSSFPLLFHPTEYTFLNFPSVDPFVFPVALTICPLFFFIFSPFYFLSFFFFPSTISPLRRFFFLLCRVSSPSPTFTPKVLPRAGVLGPLRIITSTLYYRHLIVVVFFLLLLLLNNLYSIRSPPIYNPPKCHRKSTSNPTSRTSLRPMSPSLAVKAALLFAGVPSPATAARRLLQQLSSSLPHITLESTGPLRLVGVVAESASPPPQL